MASSSPNITHLLIAWRSGDENAGRDLIEIVYPDLRRLAAHYMQSERTNHTLQPTAVVHELYLKLFSSDLIPWHNRGHFLANAAKQLRYIIVDHARGLNAQKRGGAGANVAIEDASDFGHEWNDRVIELNDALDRLYILDERAALVVEMLYFGGLSYHDIETALGISVATIKRDWRFARTWLMKDMGSRG